MTRQLLATNAALATGHPLGATAGLEILSQDGNAIDAAVAATLALCVVIPGSVGLGGYGGSAVVFQARTGRTLAIDFDSRAPLAFQEGLVTGKPESNYYGALAVTVPAVVAGLDRTLREFGTKTWSEISQPAIRLAENGFEFDQEHERYLNRCAPKFDRRSLEALFPHGLPKVGDVWRQPNLARLLRRLAIDGPGSFYEPEIATSIVDFLRERGGILSEEDFRECDATLEQPIRAKLRDVELYTPGPPSGGVTSLAIIRTMEAMLQAELIAPWQGEYFHLLAETQKACWRERQRSLGDPDIVDVSVDKFLSDEATSERIALIQSNGDQPGVGHANDSPHTSNVVAADRDGNLISLTATQGWMYGSHLVVDSLGLVLNHGMSRFDYAADHPNAPAAGKRMLHNMTPTIALHDGRAAFAFGLPGGPKIVNVTAQLALNTVVFGSSTAAAIDAPRVHTTGDEPLLVSQSTSSEIIDGLVSRGHTVRREADMGGPVNVLAVDQKSGTIDVASGEFNGAVAGI